MNDPNAAGPQAQGQFGRLKPETFAVYPSPSIAPNPTEGAHAPSVAPEPSIPEPVLEPTKEEQTEAQAHSVDDIEHVTDPALVAESETDKSGSAPAVDLDGRHEAVETTAAETDHTN